MNYCIIITRLNHWRNYVKHTLKLIVYIITIFALTAFTQDTLSVKKFREPGDTLDISISQELDHAIYNSITWLKNRQNPDGSFGKNSKLKNTALTIIALASDSDRNYTENISKASEWLTKELNSNPTTNICTAAWCCAALTIQQGNGDNPPPPCATPQFLARHYSEAKDLEAHLCTEILRSINYSDDRLKLKEREVDEKNYFQSRISFHEMWLSARNINRSGGQIYSKTGERVNWRVKYAEKLIGCQKVDPKGGGFWPGTTPAETLCNTALAIIISKEI